MSSTDHLFPQVEFEINGQSLTPIPPDKLLEFVFTSEAGGSFDYSALFLDVSLRDIENVLFSKIPGEQKVTARFRFGFFPDAVSPWYDGENLFYMPEFAIPTRIRLGGIASALRYNAVVKPRSYEGKISDVVQKVAEECFLEPNIEETDDDWRAERDQQGKLVPQGYWFNEGIPPLDFVAQRLAPLARPKNSSSGGQYLAHFGEHPLGLPSPQGKLGWLTFRPSLNFWEGKNIDVPTFQTLYGKSEEVLSFRPLLKTGDLGPLATSSLTVAGYDETSKRYITVEQSVVRTKDLVLLGDRSMVGEMEELKEVEEEEPPEEGQPQKARVSPTQLLITPGYTDVQSLTDYSKNAWLQLFMENLEAELELIGTPETMKLTPGGYVRVMALMPDGEPHWSSGIWLIDTVKHTITNKYTVHCLLMKNAASGLPLSIKGQKIS